MPEGESEWKAALLRPSSKASVAAIILGSWMLVLDVLNIVIGVHSDGGKVRWIDFLTNGSEVSQAHEFGILIPDDLLFSALGFGILALGMMGLGRSVEGGFKTWSKQLPSSPIFSSLLSNATWRIFLSTPLRALLRPSPLIGFKVNTMFPRH